jgi:putative redox protein
VAIRGTGTGLAQTITTAEPYTINMDTYKSLGGKETAPSPLSYSLASLSGCTQVTGVLVARDHGIKTGRWEVDVKGALDSDVLVKGAKEGHGNWESVEVVVRVETDLGEGQADKDRFEVFRRETERRCPLSQLFIRSGVKWTNEWVNVTTVA